jgi:hypothetical protein
MATEVIRQSVKYYLPDSPAKDHFITNDFFNNIINCLLTNITELDSINAVTDNEISRKGGNGYNETITQLSRTTSANYNHLKDINNKVQKQKIITANDIGIIYNIAKLLLQQMNSKFNSKSVDYWAGPCKLVCQASCQSTCQISCQSCHDKKCGGGF